MDGRVLVVLWSRWTASALSGQGGRNGMRWRSEPGFCQSGGRALQRGDRAIADRWLPLVLGQDQPYPITALGVA
jgi:hypothetical protein